MQFFKFNILFVSFITSFYASAFSDMECIKSSFNLSVTHKSSLFGLLEKNIKMKKAGCVISISHEKLKYIKSDWEVDVCRSPVHIKKNGGVDVLKKPNRCQPGSEEKYCSELDDLMKKVQDDALIFAKGSKDDLSQEHGQAKCGFMLLKAYLEKGLVITENKEYQNILSGNNKPVMNTINQESSAAEVPVKEGAVNQEGLGTF